MAYFWVVLPLLHDRIQPVYRIEIATKADQNEVAKPVTSLLHDMQSMIKTERHGYIEHPVYKLVHDVVNGDEREFNKGK